MNLILENLVGGELTSQVYPFFAPYGASTGPNGEYNVDLGIFFRGGNVSVDDITLTAGVGPIESDFEWTANVYRQLESDHELVAYGHSRYDPRSAERHPRFCHHGERKQFTTTKSGLSIH